MMAVVPTSLTVQTVYMPIGQATGLEFLLVIPQVTVYAALAAWAVAFAAMVHHLWRAARAIPDPASVRGR